MSGQAARSSASRASRSAKGCREETASECGCLEKTWPSTNSLSWTGISTTAVSTSRRCTGPKGSDNGISTISVAQSGYRLWKSAMAFMTWSLAVPWKPMRNSPPTPRATSRTSSTVFTMASKAGRSPARSCSPSGVSRTRRLVRSTSRAPVLLSRDRNS